jgi:lipopolysaccharide export system protein LptA
MQRRKADQPWRRRFGAAALAAGLLLAGASTGGAGEAPEEKPKADTKTKAETKNKPEGKAKSKAGGPLASKDPIYITSDRMEGDRQKNIVIYLGKVVATQGEMTMHSDKLTTYFDPDLQQIKQLIAEGKLVRVTQGDRIATGTKAVFDGVAQTVTMTGKPVVRQGNSQMSGAKIIYSLTDDKVTVESGPDERVIGIIYPEELQQKKDEGEPKKEK